MHKVKTVLLLLLTVILLGAGSLLPMGAAYVQDRAARSAVQYQDIEALELQLKDEVQPSMSIHEKLYFLMNASQSVEVDADHTRLNQDGILAALVEALQPYVDAGLLPVDLDTDVLELHPIMAYSTEHTEAGVEVAKIIYIWYIYLSYDSLEGDSLGVYLDDETGKILILDWYDPTDMITGQRRKDILTALEAVYFGSLEELNPVAANVEPTEPLVYYEEMGLEPPVGKLYQCVDTVYGELRIEFAVYDHGYHVSVY